MRYSAVIREFEIIGEAVGKLSAAWKDGYPEIPWQDIKDLQTSYHDICNPTGTQYNTMLMLEVLKHTGSLLSNHIADADKAYIQEHLDVCEIFKVTPFASETALLWKRGMHLP